MRSRIPILACSRAGLLTRLLVPAILLSGLACRQDTESPTGPDSGPTLATTATSALAFRQVSAGVQHTCGVTPDDRAYCWGVNSDGELGDGTTTQRLTPVPVLGGLKFRQVSAGQGHTCGVTTDNRAYCWGNNLFHQLGDGTTTTRLTPVPVAGGLRFRQVSVGDYHTCGWTYPDSRAYCWGFNGWGGLGDGTNADRASPVAVAGGRVFRQVSAGFNHTCAVTPTYEAYCWGLNDRGQLGDSTEVAFRLAPVLVAGGHRFAQADAGLRQTCAVTSGGRAFCWGDGRQGQLGNGKTYLSFWPRRVAGTLYFTRVSVGNSHTCAETNENRAYCWGINYFGQLGDGTTTTRLTPVAVAGGLYFSQVSAGYHTCGRTPEAVAYCWGDNFAGQLGDGTTTDRLVPTAVSGPM
jgi:alpha-tubulin suppressor-like RCC1 family protein